MIKLPAKRDPAMACHIIHYTRKTENVVAAYARVTCHTIVLKPNRVKVDASVH